MARKIRVRAVRRREVDEDKLALAFLMLARILDESPARARDVDPDLPTNPESV